MEKLKFQYSEAARASGLALPFGILLAQGVATESLSHIVKNIKPQKMSAVRENENIIRERVLAFERFFDSQGFKSPLQHQLESTLKKGLPTINPLVDTLLMCEMSNGLLMGAQDFDYFSGGMVYDVLTQEESFEGMRNTIVCRPKEIILRDDVSIIASYFQGPDKRTSIRPSTKNVIFFAFFAPEIKREVLEDSLLSVNEILEPVSENVEVSVYD